MDYIETTDAEMLSESWDEFHHDHNLRTNFFKDLSRIMLTLSQLPLPCIGSWTIDERGVLRLTNRPLAHHFHSLENEGIPTNIPRNLTYTTTDAYYADLLSCHDSRIRNQPNSMINEEDGLSQMANLFTMRGLLPFFASRDLRNGPFIFNLTDLHRSNIFVDSNWHIKYVIDLEWACSLPIEMLAPPYWITNRGVDELRGEELQNFDTACKEFMDIFEEEEKSFSSVYGSAMYRADIMRKGWKMGNFCYFQHIQPIFEPRRDIKFAQMVSAYWAPDAQEVVAAKLEDKKKYEQQLRQLFKEAEHSEVNL
jgi:hypothetical protein